MCECSVVRLEMEYTGDKSSKSNHGQGKFSRCLGSCSPGEIVDIDPIWHWHDLDITLGGKVEYLYTVTNPNTILIEEVSIEDDQLGAIASGLSIPAGESVTVSEIANVYGTTTNVGSAIGKVNGEYCDVANDTVTVIVPAD